MRKTRLPLALGIAATVTILVVTAIGLRSLLNDPLLQDSPGSELQVLLRYNGQPASGHVEIRNVKGDVVRRKKIGESGETKTHLEPGKYTIVSTDGAHCGRETATLSNSPNAVFIECRT